MNKAEELVSAIQGVAKKLRNIKEQKFDQGTFQNFTLATFRYLEEIYRLGNPTFVELTKQMGLSKPTVTLTIAKLIEKGVVTKTRSKEDGRSYKLRLTKQGVKIIETYNAVYQEFVDQIATKYKEDELDTLISLLNRM